MISPNPLANRIRTGWEFAQPSGSFPNIPYLISKDSLQFSPWKMQSCSTTLYISHNILGVKKVAPIEKRRKNEAMKRNAKLFPIVTRIINVFSRVRTAHHSDHLPALLVYSTTPIKLSLSSMPSPQFGS